MDRLPDAPPSAAPRRAPRLVRAVRRAARRARLPLLAAALAAAAACGRDGATAPGALDRVVIDRASDTTLFVNQSVDLRAVALDGARRELVGLTRSVEWTSDAPAVADVDPATGVVVAKAPGVARVKASVAGVADVVTFQISHAVAVVEVVLPDGPVLAVANEFRACAVVRAANGDVISDVEPRWSVSDSSVIALSETVGRCTTLGGVGSGSATVVAELAGKRGQNTVRVTSPPDGGAEPDTDTGGGDDDDDDDDDDEGGNGNGNGNGNNGNGGNGNGSGGR